MFKYPLIITSDTLILSGRLHLEKQIIIHLLMKFDLFYAVWKAHYNFLQDTTTGLCLEPPICAQGNIYESNNLKVKDSFVWHSFEFLVENITSCLTDCYEQLFLLFIIFLPDLSFNMIKHYTHEVWDLTQLC
jgi:hypothetical protein